MGALYKQIEAIIDSTYIECASITQIALELAQFIQLHQDLEHVKSGIIGLVHGQLSPHLVPAQDLADVIENVTATLKAQSYTLCTKTPQDVYTSRTFQYVRHGRDLIIKVFLPFSEWPAMNLYSSAIFPMPVAGRQNFVTQLVRFPNYVLTHLATGRVGEILEEPQFPIVDVSKVRWHNQQSCPLALFTDNPYDVQEYCEFVTHRQLIEPS